MIIVNTHYNNSYTIYNYVSYYYIYDCVVKTTKYAEVAFLTGSYKYWVVTTMEYSFTDLVNMEELCELMDSLCKDYSISCTIVDPLNTMILFTSGIHSVPCGDENSGMNCLISGDLFSPEDFSFSPVCAEGIKREGNTEYGIDGEHKKNHYCLYKCSHDLAHALLPFVFEGKHIVSVHIGPFIPEHDSGCKGVVGDVPLLSYSEVEMLVSRTGKVLDLLVNAGKLTLKLRECETGLINYEKELSSCRKKLSSFDRMKKELISIFSHEVRTPLSIIKGYNELLYDGILGPVCSEQADALDKSLLSINKLERIVDSLQYIDMDHSAHTYDFLPLNFSDIVETTLMQSARAIKEKNLKLQTEFPENMPSIMGDSKKLFHALSYLLDNAIKFSPAGSTISISARQEQGRLCISIRDNGIGILKEDISRVFEEFYQADSSLTRNYSGVGLGLNICQRIINCHNGNIRVESRMNEGSTFHIDLPLMIPEDNLFYQAD